MSKVTIIRIPHGFKIKSKYDAGVFMNECMVNGHEYYIVTDASIQYVFRKYKDGNISVLYRCGDLHDIFNPLLEIARTKDDCYARCVVDYIWMNRKYINAKWFNEER